uniref:Transposase MuDR plant domain-containing protein n=1 Tax=Lactuca sativa TaxID=4236 RepID=A0A9R1XBA3_LACSA|nr:hypothetical protein LSAT_V11C500293020 [Lactuca sativa]
MEGDDTYQCRKIILKQKMIPFMTHPNQYGRARLRLQESSMHIPTSKFKLKLKYGGYFRLTKNSCRQIYCFGSQKCIHIDTFLYKLCQLHYELVKRYSSKNNPKFSILYVDKYALEKSIIELDSDEKFMVMLGMYGSKKQVTIYVTTDNNLGSNNHTNHSCANRDEPNDDYDAYLCPSEESYHSHLNSDNEDDLMNNDDEVYSFSKNSISMEIGSIFENVVDFRRALNHFAVTNEFNYYIQKSDPTRFTSRCEKPRVRVENSCFYYTNEVTFEVKKMVEVHTYTRSNKGGNSHATQGWIANVITDKLKSDGDQAYTDMYGKWQDSFMKMDEFKEELLQRNEGGIVIIDFDIVGGKKLFRRFFICLAACSRGFLVGCRPYIGLDVCHLKGKFNGVLATTTGIDAIGIPNGLVISPDMQKGLKVAMMNVYPNVEHKEFIRHLYSNFKKHFRGDFFNTKLRNGALVPITKNHLNDIAKNLGEYEVTRSCDNQVEVKYKGTHWETNLKEDTNVCDVESMNTEKRHVKIQHLKVSIKVKHPHLKGTIYCLQ